MEWKRALQGPIKEDLITHLEKLIEKETEEGNIIKVCVGTDSQRRGRGYNYVTVIILERKIPMGENKNGSSIYKGNGGMVIYRELSTEGIPSLNERMIREVQQTVEVAYEIFPLLDLYDVSLELHADINQNPKHGSNVALNSAVGYMSGIQCEIKVKPDAYAASNTADWLL